MTLIIAIQTEDCVIVAADNRYISAAQTGDRRTRYHSNQNKLYLWDGGVVTGCGEAEIPKRILAWLQENKQIDLLPQQLNYLKTLRSIEVGEHEQITNAKVIFTALQNNQPQLFMLGLTQPMVTAELNEIVMFFPLDYSLLTASMALVQTLQESIQQRHDFPTDQRWINYYMDFFTKIYAMQSNATYKVSASFDVFFQSNSDARIIHCNNISDVKMKGSKQKRKWWHFF